MQTANGTLKSNLQSPSQMKSAWYLLVGCLLVANFCSAYYLYRSRVSPSDGFENVLATLKTRRSFDGRRIPRDSRYAWIVDIIEPQDDRSIASFRATSRQFANREFTWILVTSDPDSLVQKLGADGPRIFVVQMSNQETIKLIASPVINGRWFVFDPSGNTRAAGDSLRGGLVGQLLSVERGEPGYSPTLLQSRLFSLDKVGAFASIRELAPSAPAKRALAFFLSYISTGCAAETLLGQLNTAADHDLSTLYLVVLPGTWSADEVEAFKVNLDVRVKVIQTGPQATAAWTSVGEQFGPQNANAFVAIFNSEPEIRVITDPQVISRLFGGTTNAR